MKNMKVRNKMLTGFIIVTLIGTLLGVVGIAAIGMIKSGSQEVASLQGISTGASDVLSAHYKWRHALTEAVLAEGEFTGSLDPGTCALGKWLGSEEAKSITDPTVLELLQRIEDPHRFIHIEAGIIIELIESGDIEGAKAILLDIILPRTQEVISYLTEIEARFGELIDARNDELLQLENIASVVIVLLVIVSAVISIFLALYLAGLISKPLVLLSKFMHKAGTTGDIALSHDEAKTIRELSALKDEIGQTVAGSVSFVGHVSNIAKELETVASGDLTNDINPLSDSDVMGNSMKQMLDNFNNMFDEIHTSTAEVSSGSKQISDGAQSLAQGSTQQAASIQELSSSIAEIAMRAKENHATAEKSATLSMTIMDNAEKGNRQMAEMIAAVDEINEASKNISKIIKTIDDIAFQTNILALNAAVEAARAGNHGKGFAVVAEEVRNLASKSAEAAKDTGNMIQNSINKAELGSQIAGENAASLLEIINGIKESSHLIAEIANSSEQQTLGIAQVNTGIDQVVQVVQHNSATAEESASASEEMTSQFNMLQQLITQFKLKKQHDVPLLMVDYSSDEDVA